MTFEKVNDRLNHIVLLFGYLSVNWSASSFFFRYILLRRGCCCVFLY